MEIAKILKMLNDHRLWYISVGKEGVQGDFTGMDLRGVPGFQKDDLIRRNLIKAILVNVNLAGADLIGFSVNKADLTGANLTGANLRDTILENANLSEANLENARLNVINLAGANLTKANLRGARIGWSNLIGANLTEADLTGAKFLNSHLVGANLTGAKLPEFQISQNVTLIGYKKVRYGTVLKLEIPPKANRTGTPLSNKCRAEFAKVIGWRKMEEKEFHTEPGEFGGIFEQNFIYRMGEIVRPHFYEPDIREECTGGIHFFLEETDAQNY